MKTVKDDFMLRGILKKTPPSFPCNHLEGPLKEQELHEWAIKTHGLKVKIDSDIYQLYLQMCREAILPGLTEECQQELMSGTSEEEIATK